MVKLRIYEHVMEALLKSPYKYLSQMLEVIILTRMRRGVYCRTGSIHAQLSGGARAALIFV